MRCCSRIGSTTHAWTSKYSFGFLYFYFKLKAQIFPVSFCNPCMLQECNRLHFLLKILKSAYHQMESHWWVWPVHSCWKSPEKIWVCFWTLPVLLSPCLQGQQEPLEYQKILYYCGLWQNLVICQLVNNNTA